MSGAIIHGGGIAAAAALYGGRPEDWLDLSTGLNPCPPALPVIPARVWHRLPDRHLFDATRPAAREVYRAGEILPLQVPGTQSVIQLLPRLSKADRPVSILAPTSGEYGRVLAARGRNAAPQVGGRPTAARRRLVRRLQHAEVTLQTGVGRQCRAHAGGLEQLRLPQCGDGFHLFHDTLPFTWGRFSARNVTVVSHRLRAVVHCDTSRVAPDSRK